MPAAQRLAAPAHSHDHFAETIYGLDGVLTWTVDGQPIDVGPGQALCIPRGAVHRFDNNELDARALVITPAAIGPRFFREAAEVIAAAAGGSSRPDTHGGGDARPRPHPGRTHARPLRHGMFHVLHGDDQRKGAIAAVEFEVTVRRRRVVLPRRPRAGQGAAAPQAPLSRNLHDLFGRAAMWIDGTEVIAGPGDVVVIGPGVPHRFTATGDERIVVPHRCRRSLHHRPARRPGRILNPRSRAPSKAR